MQRAETSEEEKIRKERERIRIASQKTRQKRKDEEQTLRTENEQMKRERLSLASTLQELQQTIQNLQEQLKEKDETLTENELLIRELEQYRSFGCACVLFADQFGSVEEEESKDTDISKRILAQVTKSGGEMADLQSERILAESLIDDGRWKSLNLETHISQLSTFVNGRYRLLDDGSCEWQFSFVAPWQKNRAYLFSERYRAFWVDPRPLLSIFKSSRTAWFGRIDESTVEHLATEGKASLQRIRNSNNDQSWVFVMTHSEDVKVAKSTLVPETSRDVPFFALDVESQQAIRASQNGCGLSSSSSSPKSSTSSGRQATPQQQQQVTNRIGIVDCWSGTRSSIMLDSSCVATGENCVRGKFLESFRVWNEDIQSTDPRIAGPGVRGVLVMSMSLEFAEETFGDMGFAALFNFERHTVAPSYQNFIDFLALSLGIETLSFPAS